MINSDKKRFFIIGCQRSGTTLLRLILESHHSIYCFDERRAYDFLKDKNNFSLFKFPDNSKLIGFKIPILTEQINNSFLHDYALSISMSNFYNMEPLVFIVRDCRDVICSMKNLQVSETTSWLKKC